MRGVSALDPARALLDLPLHGTGLGLHRMLHVTDALRDEHGAWLERLDAIKVTGSSGKGSVCTMVAAILGALGVRVGLYTSPHLQRFAERIVVDGRPIADAELDRSHAWLEGVRTAYEDADPDDRFGAFEAITAVALHRFAQAEVEAVVAEAGIGGRYDATRVLPGRTCGLVSVELEHAALLGGTEEAIAFDKADLCPAGGTLVVGPLPFALRRRLRAYCRLRDVTLVAVHERSEARVRSQSLRGTTAWLSVDDLVLPELVLPVAGAHQLDNAAIAIALARDWLRRHRPALGSAALVEAIGRALGSLRLPGRLERVHDDPPVIIDVGHTPGATARVAGTLEPLLGQGAAILVTGVSHDREVEGVLAPLVPLASHVVVTRARHRGGDPQRVTAVLAQRWQGRSYEVAATVEDALRRALPRARAEGRTVVVAGGLFLATEAAAVLRGEDPARLLR